MAAHCLAAGNTVDLYEQGRTLGRKFLVAGDGGLNITNAAEGGTLLKQYTPSGFLDDALSAFGPTQLRQWLAQLGVGTFTGSSGRVFPERGVKPAMVLKAIREDLRTRGVRIHLRHGFAGFDPQARPIVEHEGLKSVVRADAVLFALGGASWPRTGSRGDWRAHFDRIGVLTKPFAASNCGLETPWPPPLVRHHAGKPLKNIRVSAGDPSSPSGLRSVRGEATITRYGLEGNAIYPMVPAVRHALAHGMKAHVIIDLKPDVPEHVLAGRLHDASPEERTAALRLDRAAMALLKAHTSKEEIKAPELLAHAAKHLRVPISGPRPIDEAISTVGGIALEEVAPDLSLRKHPHLFVAGEMLDWDAPTGGFLLQAAFSMGYRAAQGMLAR